MRNVGIGIGFVAVVGIAAVLGWFAWQNTQQSGVLSSSAGGDNTSVAQSDPVPAEGADASAADADNTTSGAEEQNAGASASAADAQNAAGGPASDLRFVYLWDSRLGLWHGGEDQNLATADSNHPPQISSDGRLIAFVRDGSLWVMNAEGEEERLLVSESEIESMGNAETSARLHRFAWLPGTHHLLFNTALNIDMGFTLTNDLYRVEADSLDLVELLPSGTGGEFTIAPNGQAIAVVAPDQIRLIAPDGAELRPAFAYEPVLTYSEFAYYPQAVWSAESNRVAVAIPHAEGFVNTQEPATVWALGIDAGEPEMVGQIQSDAPSFWIDPTLQYIAYMRAVELEAEPEVEVEMGADGEIETPGGYAIAISPLDGSEIHSYFEGAGQFLGWSPDGAHFTVVSPGEAEPIQLGAIGQADLIPLAGLNHAFSHQVTWLDAEQYIVVGGDSMETAVALGSVSGELTRLLELEPGSFALDPVGLNVPK